MEERREEGIEGWRNRQIEGRRVRERDKGEKKGIDRRKGGGIEG